MTIATLLIALIAVPTNTDESAGPIMLDFTASWCGPCRQMRPVVDQLIQNGYPIKPVDIDQNADLAERYQVTGVPAFVMIDPATGRELGRTEGARPASDLTTLYQRARASLQTQASTQTGEDAEAGSETAAAAAAADDADDRPAAATPTTTTTPNPKPWETVVRIKVHGNGAIGFGSGTIIHSTPQESLILTCAHIFKLENGPTPPPARFPRRITIDLFDGKLSGMKPAQVHYANETFEGQAIDYDFSRDVGLIRIRPGRRLPYAKVVPPRWKPKSNMGMITVGCSEGHDATAWNTVIVNPAMKGLNGNRTYEAIECMVAPKQGRSGGGLFTSDGYVAGVCDFAEPQGNHGLYAAPPSIYKILDRNDLVALYAPSRSRPKALLANAGASANGSAPEYRLQSPDRNDPEGVSLPPPEMLGITAPRTTGTVSQTAAPRRRSWRATPATRSTELSMDPTADTDRFDTGAPAPASSRAPEASEEPATVVRRSAGRWRAGRAALPELSTAGVP